jgi:energy-converting hydrogenase Eha subunit B
MKKITLTSIALFFLVFVGTHVNAQSFQKGQVDLNLGLGIGNTVIGPGSSGVLPPVSASLEFGITNDISIGGYLGFTKASYLYYGNDWCGNGPGNGHGNYYNYTDTYTWTYLIAGVRGAYHFGRFIKIDKLDVYAGLMLGNDFASSNYSTNSVCPDHVRYNYNNTYGGFVFALYGGARYRFTNHFGVFGELGYGVTYLNVGLNFKF